jgi:glutamate carboxypeptidase
MIRTLRLLLIATLLSCASAAPAQTTRSDEQRLLQYVDAHAEEATALLAKTVDIQSATLNVEGVRRVGAVFRDEFAALGFETRWIDMPPEMKRAGHLLAERKGTRGKRILIIGHLDTVLEGSRWNRDGARARGNGAYDMKGGDVIALYALKTLASIGALDGTQITVIFTGDEELAGEPLDVARRDLIAAGRASDAALAFEASIGNTATVGRRGITDWHLDVSGETGHSGGIFGEEVGSGANFEAARIVTEFYQQLRGEPNLTFNPSLILGGTEVTFDGTNRKGTAEGKPNVVAKSAVVEGDLRFISPEQMEAAVAKMHAIVARSLPKTSARLTFEGAYPAMAPTPGNYALLKMLDEASRAHGLGAVTALDPSKRGAGDISFVAPYVACLDGLGAQGGNAHEPEEYVDLNTLPLLIKRAALLLYHLTRE